MKSKVSIVILAIVIIIAAVFLVLDQVHAPMNTSLTSSSSLSTSSVDTSNWKSFSNAQPPFSIRYPADLAFSTSTIPTIAGPYLLDLQFPRDSYFSTVLKDEAYVIVTASSTCPSVEQGPIDKGPTTIQLDGTTFIKNEINDVAAGNRYLTITYDTNANSLCYRITFFDHGANGAGLYLSDPTAIQGTDSTHDAEVSKIEDIISAMIGTFSLPASQK